jgi:hypothetical protein
MEKLKITEHIPAYALEFAEPEIVEFSNTQELLSIEFVKGHLRQEGFYRFSIRERSSRHRVPLLAEYNGGEKWLVIGFMDGDLSVIDLPEWKSITNVIKVT